MSEKTEVLLAKIIAAIIFILAVVQVCEGNDKIAELLTKYNKEQASAFAAIVREAGKEYGIEPEIIASIIVIESGARPCVISKGGDYGLMQVRYEVHSDKVGSANELLDPKTNVFVGTKIFSQYYRQKKSLHGALVRYSGGNRKMAERVLRILKNEYGY